MEHQIDIEICAGAGGLAIGLQAAGFQPRFLIENDAHSCNTLRHNSHLKGGILYGEPVEKDARGLDWTEYPQRVRVLAAGVPCQPFSLAGKHRADTDARNLFPAVFRAIRALRPMIVLMENVYGLKRPAFEDYLGYLLRHLECLGLEQRKGEAWQEHDDRIQQYQRSRRYVPDYHVTEPKVLNAADFGVAQIRRRVFFVATRADALPKFEFPPPTHSREALIAAQQDGQYWKRHGIKPRETRAERRGPRDTNEGLELLPWRTVRDELASLPAPARSETTATNNHWLIPGARLYPGHAGSRLDWPAKTIKAGVHGVPGGENTVLLDDGTVRYFTLRETARVQGFPDEYIFTGSRIHITRQIGNAVPCPLGTAVGQAIMELLKAHESSRTTKM